MLRQKVMPPKMLKATATKLGITILDAHGIVYYGTINIQDANTKFKPTGVKGASATTLAFTQASPIKSNKKETQNNQTHLNSQNREDWPGGICVAIIQKGAV